MNQTDTLRELLARLRDRELMHDATGRESSSACIVDIDAVDAAIERLESMAFRTSLIGRLQSQVEELRGALRTSKHHLDHMAAWISKAQRAERGWRHPGIYSFESLGEDMPGIVQALERSDRI